MITNTRVLGAAFCLVTLLALTGCASAGRAPGAILFVPQIGSNISVDGRLDEPCYRELTPISDFVVAGDPVRVAPSTEAWVFRSNGCLVCAFRCVDTTPAWAAPSSKEHDVDAQDRVELFLWPGLPRGPYYCIEAAPGEAIHDYRARLYRKFDDQWSPAPGWSHKAHVTAAGYSVEIVIPKTALDAIGLNVDARRGFGLGLFRADYDRLDGKPTWITWVDHGGEPDFHVIDSFGRGVTRSPLR